MDGRGVFFYGCFSWVFFLVGVFSRGYFSTKKSLWCAGWNGCFFSWVFFDWKILMMRWVEWVFFMGVFSRGYFSTKKSLWCDGWKGCFFDCFCSWWLRVLFLFFCSPNSFRWLSAATVTITLKDRVTGREVGSRPVAIPTTTTRTTPTRWTRLFLVEMWSRARACPSPAAGLALHRAARTTGSVSWRDLDVSHSCSSTFRDVLPWVYFLIFKLRITNQVIGTTILFALSLKNLPQTPRSQKWPCRLSFAILSHLIAKIFPMDWPFFSVEEKKEKSGAVGESNPWISHSMFLFWSKTNSAMRSLNGHFCDRSMWEKFFREGVKSNVVPKTHNFKSNYK